MSAVTYGLIYRFRKGTLIKVDALDAMIDILYAIFHLILL
jgi:hypothetical protein